MTWKLHHIYLLCMLLAVSGCATTDSPDNDPLEDYNRAMTEFNLGVDDAVLVPLAKGYRKVVPNPVRGGIGNFFSNLGELYVMLNNLLQVKFPSAGEDLGRFLINSTLGVAGFADVATEMGVERNDEDFGQTLAVWGISPGPHLVLPFFGPSNFRDGFGTAVGLAYGDPIRPEDSEADLAVRFLEAVDTRTQFLGTEELLKLQPDPYLFLREGYRQRRELAIHDGRVSEQTEEEELLEDLLLD